MSDYPERFNLARWLLEDNATRRGPQRAVRSESRDLTYTQLSGEVERVQSVLQELGVSPEDRVLLVLPDVPEFVTTWLAVLRGGAVFAMVNPLLPADDYEYYLEYSRAPVAVVHETAWENLSQVLSRARHLRHVLTVGFTPPPEVNGISCSAYEALVPAADSVAPFDSHRDDLAGWLFTSGTSGKPKAALHFHQDFAWNIDRYAKQVLAMSESDITMAVSKLFFGYATGTNLMFPFAVGAQTALFSERSTAENVVAQARRYRPTMLSAVPTTLNGILQLSEASVKEAFSSLRMVISAGEALPPELLVAFQERFGVEILDGIGSAEMFHIYISNYPGDVKPGSLGRLVPGYESRIVGSDGHEVAVGEPGELWIKGGSTAAGYWLAREKSRRTFRGDWTITGDLFRCDPDGYYWYEGRADDMLKVGGIWVAPKEVEESLLTHEAVRECCVVGHRGSDGLVIPLAFVAIGEAVKSGPALTEELQDYVKTHLARYKYPRRIEYLDQLPRNDRGKIARARLRQMAEEL